MATFKEEVEAKIHLFEGKYNVGSFRGTDGKLYLDSALVSAYYAPDLLAFMAIMQPVIPSLTEEEAKKFFPNDSFVSTGHI